MGCCDKKRRKTVGGLVVPTASELLHYGGTIVRGVSKITHDEAMERREKCRVCDHATNRLVPPNPDGTDGDITLTSLSQCDQCACFIHPKTKSSTEHCPIGNW